MAGREPSRARRAWLGALAAAVLLTTTGCIGTTSRSDFDDVLHDRSGGVPASLPGRAIDAVEERLGVTSIRLRSLDIDPRRQVRLVVQVPGTTDELDHYTYADGNLSAATALSTSVRDSLEMTTFAPDRIPAMKALGDLVTVALGELDIPDARFDGLTVRRGTTGVEIKIEAESARRSGQVRFDEQGAVVEVSFD